VQKNGNKTKKRNTSTCADTNVHQLKPPSMALALPETDCSRKPTQKPTMAAFFRQNSIERSGFLTAAWPTAFCARPQTPLSAKHRADRRPGSPVWQRTTRAAPAGRWGRRTAAGNKLSIWRVEENSVESRATQLKSHAFTLALV
jgi:hypothetical protein